MGLKTVGTLTWKACKYCRHGVDGSCDPLITPEFHCDRNNNTVECADYLENEKSEE
jgi:hypothetical protein